MRQKRIISANVADPAGIEYGVLGDYFGHDGVFWCGIFYQKQACDRLVESLKNRRRLSKPPRFCRIMAGQKTVLFFGQFSKLTKKLKPLTL